VAESEKLSIRANAATRVRMCVGFKLTKERYEDFLGSNIAMSDRFRSLRNRLNTLNLPLQPEIGQ